jgi:ribosomal protein S18 acetylase RimI-like enzyme
MADFNKEFNESSPRSISDHRIGAQVYLRNERNLQMSGFKMSLRRSIGKFLSSIFATNSAIWFEKDLTEKLAEYQPKIPVEIDMNSTSQTIEWLKKQNERWVVHPQEIATALKYNHCWPSARINGEIIGCIKIGFGNVFIVDYNKVVEFPDRMAFIYDTYVLEDMRGKGVAKYLITRAIKFIKTKGYTKVGCHIPPWNKVSIGAYEEMGFKKVNYIRNFRFFGVSIRIAKPPNNFSMFTKGKILKENIPYGRF